MARIDRELNIAENISRQRAQSRQVFITTLTSLKERFEKLKLFKLVQSNLNKHKPGSREIYHNIFSPIIKPNFLYAKLVTKLPAGARELEAYRLENDTKVSILDLPGKVGHLMKF